MMRIRFLPSAEKTAAEKPPSKKKGLDQVVERVPDEHGLFVKNT